MREKFWYRMLLRCGSFSESRLSGPLLHIQMRRERKEKPCYFRKWFAKVWRKGRKKEGCTGKRDIACYSDFSHHHNTSLLSSYCKSKSSPSSPVDANP